MAKTVDKMLVAGLSGLALAGAYMAFGHRNRFSFRDRVVLITGGSRGLGLVLARQLAEEGARIAICARDNGQIERAEIELRGLGARVYAAQCDVRLRPDVKKFVREVGENLGPVDVLINCAGVISVGPLITQTQKDFEDLMAAHFWGPYFMMEEVLPTMRSRGEGRIVNITSIGAKIAVPHLAAYCASKFALAGLSHAYATELAEDGISVTTVYPGLMRTGSHINAKFKGQHKKEFALFSLADATSLSTIAAERAAAKIIDACAHGRSELVISIQAKVAASVRALAPEITAQLLSLTARFLPDAGGIGTASLPGLASTSAISPSPLTALIDQASIDNNEL